MGVRERVHRAIEGPVAAAAKLVDEAAAADDHTKLSLQLNGWFRGLEAALEELAVELEVLREELTRHPDQPLEPARQAEGPDEDDAPAEDAADETGDDEELDEAGLAERARAARAETSELRENERAHEGEGGSAAAYESEDIHATADDDERDHTDEREHKDERPSED